MLASQNKVFYEQSQKKLARQRKIWQEKCSKLKKKNRNKYRKSYISFENESFEELKEETVVGFDHYPFRKYDDTRRYQRDYRPIMDNSIKGCSCVRRLSDRSLIGGKDEYEIYRGIWRIRDLPYSDYVKPHICSNCIRKYGEKFYDYLRVLTRSASKTYRGLYNYDKIPDEHKWENHLKVNDKKVFIRLHCKIDEDYALGFEENTKKKVLFWYNNPCLTYKPITHAYCKTIPKYFNIHYYRIWLNNHNEESLRYNDDGSIVKYISYFQWLQKHHKQEAKIQMLICLFQTRLFFISKYIFYFLK